MNRLNIPNPSNGIKAFWDDLEYLLGIADFASDENSGGIIQFLESFLNEIGGGNDFIVSGCIGATPMSAGWIFMGGELLKVPEHAITNSYFEKITVNPTEGDRIDAAGSSVSIYDQYTATATAMSGTLQVIGDRLDDVLLDYLGISDELALKSDSFTNDFATTSPYSYTHGLDYTKIKAIKVSWNGLVDFESSYLSGTYTPNGYIYAGATTINIKANPSGYWAAIGSATWEVLIWYEKS